MSSYNNIEKIKYTKNTSEVVNLKEYIIFENEREEVKYVVFKFANEVNQQLIGMEFEVSQYNAEGALLETSIVIYDRFLSKPNEEFVPNAKLKINYRCKTISVKLKKAAFDRFLWNDGSYEDNSYSFEHYYRDEQAKKPAPEPVKKEKPEKQKKKKTKGKKFELKRQTKKNIARFPAIFLAFIFIAVSACVGVSLYFFKKDGKRFTLGDFKVLLIDEKSVGIYGYTGDEDMVIIPQKISDYSIVSIESGAFTDCNMTEVWINADLVIHKNSFVSCKKLTDIYLTGNIRLTCETYEICKDCKNAYIWLPNAN